MESFCNGSLDDFNRPLPGNTLPAPDGFLFEKTVKNGRNRLQEILLDNQVSHLQLLNQPVVAPFFLYRKRRCGRRQVGIPGDLLKEVLRVGVLIEGEHFCHRQGLQRVIVSVYHVIDNGHNRLLCREITREIARRIPVRQVITLSIGELRPGMYLTSQYQKGEEVVKPPLYIELPHAPVNILRMPALRP